MNKKTLVAFSLTALLSIGLSACNKPSPEEPIIPAGEKEEIKGVEFIAKDGGNFYQASIDGKLFDAIGYEEYKSGLAIIKQTHPISSFTYRGMFYNRSVIEGLTGITVNFEEGKNLYCVSSEYLMEDMSFPLDADHKLESGKSVLFNEGDCYFVVYTDDEVGVSISSIDVYHDASISIADSLAFGPNEIPYGSYEQVGEPRYIYARSMPSAHSLSYDLIDVTNNPLNNTNNYSNKYSTGTHGEHPNAWYRWNGVSLCGSKDLGSEFSLHTTIIGNISQMIDESKYFNFSVWPQFRFEGSKTSGAGGGEGWVYAMLGNDDYEPLGHVVGESDGAINTDYNAFSGRFFTEYCGEFNPQTAKVTDESMTYGELFAANPLPFWHVEFKIFKENDVFSFAVLINGVNAFQDTFANWVFDTAYDGSLPLSLNTMCFHLVNYGQGNAGANVYDPQAAYNGTFTMPRVK